MTDKCVEIMLRHKGKLETQMFILVVRSEEKEKERKQINFIMVILYTYYYYAIL